MDITDHIIHDNHNLDTNRDSEVQILGNQIRTMNNQ